MIINNSSFLDYENCPRLWFYKELLRLSKKRRDGDESSNVDREEGLLWHEVMAAWRNRKLHEDPNIRLELAEGIIKDYYAAKAKQAEFGDEELAAKERGEYFLKLFRAYLKRYPSDPWETVDVERDGITCLGDECHACGEPYHEDLRRGVRIQKSCECGAEIDYLVGQADIITTENDVLGIGDYKTKKASGGVSSNTLAGFGTSSQVTTYMYIFMRVLARVIGRAFVDVVVKLKLVDERGDPFKRTEAITRTTQDFAGFVEDRREILRQIRHDIVRLQEIKGDLAKPLELEKESLPGVRPTPFRRNTNHCYQYGECPMLALCHPARYNWWEVPAQFADDYEQRPERYVDDYRHLIEEEIQ